MLPVPLSRLTRLIPFLRSIIVFEWYNRRGICLWIVILNLIINGFKMLTNECIINAVKKAARVFPLVKVTCFGSYANGEAGEHSDLDLLVEFEQEHISILNIIGLKQYYPMYPNVPNSPKLPLP